MTVTSRRWRPTRPLRSSVSARRPLSRIFAVGASVVLLLVTVGIVLGAAGLIGLYESRADQLQRVAPAQEAGQRLSIAMLDQETGLRGFVLTGRDAYLDPFRAGGSTESQALATLRGLTVGAPIDAVERAGQRWRAEFAEPMIAAVRDGTPLLDQDAGKVLFDELRSRTDDLRAGLSADQAAGRQRVADAAGFLAVAAVGVAVVLLLVLLIVGIGLRRTVLRPVSELAGQVREVVRGDMSRPVRTEGPREIAELGEDVDAMRLHILAELDVLQGTNQRLDQQTRDLERSNRDLEQFAYVASHDLQEPLRKVSSFCQLLQRRYGGQLDDRADQYIEFAVDGAQRMQRLINDLLAFSRVGRSTEGFVDVPLGEVAAAAAAGLETSRAEVDGEIVVGELPTVTGDPQLLRQLLVNLIGNSLKFHRDGVPPVVRVAGERRGDTIEITVSDNGIGIEAEYADKVFVIFQRLHARDVYPGTGIGLSLAKKIVEFHGGAIRLDPGDGHGATVALTFPTDPEEGPRMTTPEPRIVNVLLVEDDPGDVLMTREAFDEYLHNRLDVVTDGAEALAYLRHEPPYVDAPRPDLILLDLNLPRRDGREVLKEVKDDPALRHIPVIVLTTSQAEEDVLRSYQLHANAYVTKPVDFEGFIEAIKQIDHFFVSVVQLPTGRDGT